MKFNYTMKQFIFLLIIVFYLPSFSQSLSSASVTEPNRIVLSWKEDPSTTQSVNWQTSFDSSAWVEYTIDNGSPYLEQSAIRINGVSKKFKTEKGYFFSHEATIRDIEPNTVYTYRVGNGNISSDWYQFKTLPTVLDSFSFLYFGDVQNYIEPLARRVLVSAVKKAPDARFITIAGDLVGSGTKESSWDEFFEIGDWIFSSTPVMPAIGNHEYGYDRQEGQVVYAPNYDNTFSLPENGPEGFKELFYYFDIGNLRIVSIDNTALSYNIYPEKIDDLLKWIENALNTNQKKWSIVVCHQPIFSSLPSSRKGGLLQEKLLPVLEKHKVDMILQGHHHNYSRGFNENSGKIPVHVISVSGGKMYPVNFDNWKERVSANRQFYQVIHVGEDRMEFKSYMANNELFDHFKIEYLPNKEKTFVDLAPSIEGNYDLPTANIKKFFKNDSIKTEYEKQKNTYINKKNIQSNHYDKVKQLGHIKTWTKGIGSSDPGGLGYHSDKNCLILSDSEINEYAFFGRGDNKYNIFLIPLDRKVASEKFLCLEPNSAGKYNAEPTGVMYNSNDGFYYVTNDNANSLAQYDSMFNPTGTYIDLKSLGCADPEGLAYDPKRDEFYVCSGSGGSKEIFVINGNFQLVRKFYVGDVLNDPEGITVNPETNHVFIVSGGRDNLIAEYDPFGKYIDKYSIQSLVPKPVGINAITIVPNENKNGLRLFLGDRGIDNNNTPPGEHSEDGVIYEIIISCK